MGLRRIPEQCLNLRGPEVARIDSHYESAMLIERSLTNTDSLPRQFDPQSGSTAVDKLAHAVLPSSGNNIVLRPLLLKHEPLHFDVVTRMAPITHGVKIAQVERFLQTHFDAREAASDLAGYKGLAAHRRLVVEEDADAGEDSVGFAIVHTYPVGIELCHSIGRARVKGRRLALRDLLY